jgi:hypothetical protein
MERFGIRRPKTTVSTTEEAAKTILTELREEIEPSSDDELGPGIEPDYERFLPADGRQTFEENIAHYPEYLRNALADALFNLADAYDSLGHRYTPGIEGITLQRDCGAIRQLARSFDIAEPPRDTTELPVSEQ